MFFKKLLGQALPNEQVGGGCGPSSGLAIFREQVAGARLSREGGSCLPSFQAALLLGVGGPGLAVAETLNRGGSSWRTALSVERARGWRRGLRLTSGPSSAADLLCGL